MWEIKSVEDDSLTDKGYLWAYVYNYDNPELSEFGTVCVDNELRRIY